MKRLVASKFASMAVIGAFTLGILTATAVNALSSTESHETGSPVVQGTLTATVITEDMEGWDCATMGNRVCGPVDLRDPMTRCILALESAHVTGVDCTNARD